MFDPTDAGADGARVAEGGAVGDVATGDARSGSASGGAGPRSSASAETAGAGSSGAGGVASEAPVARRPGGPVGLASVLEGAAVGVMDEIAVLFGDGEAAGVPVWAGERALPSEVCFDVSGVRTGLDGLAGLDPRGVDDRGLLAGMVALEEARRVLDAAALHLAAEAERRQVAVEASGLITGSWLAREGRLPRKAAIQRVNVADTLRRHLPSVDVALTAGVIGFEHARVLADAANPRIAERFDTVCPALIGAIGGASFERWRNDVTRAADLLDVDGPDPPPARPDRLHASRVGDGVSLRGEFRSADGEVIRQAIETRAQELFERYRNDAETTNDEITIPPLAERMAQALAELVREGLARDAGDVRPPRTEVQLVVGPDQLVDLAERLPESLRSVLPSAMTAGRQGLVLTDPTGTPLRREGFEHLLCDPAIEALILDQLGVPLAMGRSARLATREQRRAMARRDGGCVFPGCQSPIAWCDAHHVQHWDHGGPTDLDNLAGLCRHHHGLAHRTGWHLHSTDDGWHIWTTPAGHRFWSQRHGRQRTDPLPPPPRPQPPPASDAST